MLRCPSKARSAPSAIEIFHAVFELREFAEEDQRDDSGWSVTLFGEDQLRLAAQVLAVFLVNFFAAVAKRAGDQMKTYYDQGGVILFGTDVGYTQIYDTTSEYGSMAAAGLPWSAILASLPTNPAQFFHEANTGQGAKGFRADLVVLTADPAADPRNFAEVKYTFRSGRIIYRK